MLNLFLGFEKCEGLQLALSQANAYLLSSFIGKEEYLVEATYQGKGYIGKYLPHSCTIEQLENSEKHLMSLLKSLLPPQNTTAYTPVLLSFTDGK